MKLLTIRNIFFVAVAGLIVFAVIQCNGNKKSKVKIEELERYKTDFEQLSDIIDSLNTEHVSIKDSLPIGEIVQEPETGFDNQKRLLKTIKELQQITASNAHLRKQLERADSVNASITQQQIDEGWAWGEIVPVEKALPTVKTVKRDTGEHYKFEAVILSRGDLLSTVYDISVSPEIIRVETPGATQYISKHNYLGVSTGVLAYDINKVDADNLLIPISLVYHRKWWGVEAGIITDNRFREIGGAQLKLIAGFKF